MVPTLSDLGPTLGKTCGHKTQVLPSPYKGKTLHNCISHHLYHFNCRLQETLGIKIASGANWSLFPRQSPHQIAYLASQGYSLITLTIRGSTISLLLCAETAETLPQCHTLPSASHHIMTPSLPLSLLYDLAYGLDSMIVRPALPCHVLSQPFTRGHVLLSATVWSYSLLKQSI